MVRRWVGGLRKKYNWPSGGTGRRASLRSSSLKWGVGSNPTSVTMEKVYELYEWDQGAWVWTFFEGTFEECQIEMERCKQLRKCRKYMIKEKIN